jgi:acetyl-CoA carboxylase biotin carboxyl carrier protein
LVDIDIPKLKALLSALVEGGVTEFEFEDETVRLRINRGAGRELVVSAAAPYVGSLVPPMTISADGGPASVPPLSIASPPATPTQRARGRSQDLLRHLAVRRHVLPRAVSPMRRPSSRSGRRCARVRRLCIVEAMKLMNEIEADARGHDRRHPTRENGKPVEFGQKLFKIRSRV